MPPILFFLLVIVLAIALSVIATIIWGRQQLQRYNKVSYSVRNTDGIEVLEAVTIGGVKQWLHIRGRSKENPILLVMHGGSGVTQIGWFDAIQRPWEDFFTVAHWDQRQTGKSYAPLKEIGSTITNQQLINDAEEVVKYLREKYQQEKIFLLGKSYGSYLAMHLVKRRPEWLYAYIGDGQMISVAGFAEAEYQHILSAAKESGSEEQVQKLEAMSPRIRKNAPWQSFAEHEDTLCQMLDKIGKGMCPPELDIKSFFGVREVNRFISSLITWRDLLNARYGDKALSGSNCNFNNEFMSVNLPNEIGSEFSVPIVLFTGAHDWHVPMSYQRQWFDSISAPSKKMVVFDNSRHYPYVEEPGCYLLALVNEVRPYSSSQSK